MNDNDDNNTSKNPTDPFSTNEKDISNKNNDEKQNNTFYYTDEGFEDDFYFNDDMFLLDDYDPNIYNTTLPNNSTFQPQQFSFPSQNQNFQQPIQQLPHLTFKKPLLPLPIIITNNNNNNINNNNSDSSEIVDIFQDSEDVEKSDSTIINVNNNNINNNNNNNIKIITYKIQQNNI